MSSDQMVRLYAADVSALIEDEKLMDAAINMVSKERAKKVKRFAHVESKALSAGAELLLYAALADMEQSDVPIQYSLGEHGKPYLNSPENAFFNLSHSGRWVVCALSHREVGCDIEKAESVRSSTKIARRFFTEEEQSFIASCAGKDTDEGLRAFYRLWTLKECFLKVTGYGLALPLKDFCIIIDKQNEISVRHKLDTDADYRFREFMDFPGYCCSVCSEGCDIDGNVTEVSLEDHILSKL